MLFSQRKGLRPVREALQVESIDPGLRNRLWSAFRVHLLYTNGSEDIYSPGNVALVVLLRALWDRYFKWPVDTLEWCFWDDYERVRKEFFGCGWCEVYDLLEFSAAVWPVKGASNAFMATCNLILKEELSAYRFVGGKITEITREEEIAAVEEALGRSDKLQPIATHLDQALRLLSDKKQPDFRNSIKESVSAVEALCRLITGDPRATLGQALKKLEGSAELHPALKQPFDRLYGYTNDADGIRHAMLGETSLSSDDAKFMLVSCSAFVNYLVAKASAAGTNL